MRFSFIASSLSLLSSPFLLLVSLLLAYRFFAFLSLYASHFLLFAFYFLTSCFFASYSLFYLLALRFSFTRFLISCFSFLISVSCFRLLFPINGHSGFLEGNVWGAGKLRVCRAALAMVLRIPAFLTLSHATRKPCISISCSHFYSSIKCRSFVLVFFYDQKMSHETAGSDI